MDKLIFTLFCSIILVTPAYSIKFINNSRDQTWVDIEYEASYINSAAHTTKNLETPDLYIKKIRWQWGPTWTEIVPYGPGNPYALCSIKKPLKMTDDVTFTLDWSHTCHTSK